jgi:hypothetical protein
MKKLISKQFLMDEELDDIVGGDVKPNDGSTNADPNQNALDHANDNAAFNRGIVATTFACSAAIDCGGGGGHSALAKCI